ncbi:MAG: phosphoribosyltransferase family protein [Actinomycetota bacterium]|nr:phosphoribosyltransferase family protein [Actinomycetota bacterium]
MFQNRVSAGRQLAVALDGFRGENLLVLGIPRGGVLVAAEVAQALGAPLDLIIPRKIGAPGNEELAIGAVAGEGRAIINSGLVASLGVPEEYIKEQVKKAIDEIDRRRRRYIGDENAPDVGNKVVLLVDDGLATGYTALAAAKAVRMLGPRRIVLAVPVAPADAAARFEGVVDEFICLSTPEPFFAVGQFYSEFHQVTDEEVVSRLRELRAAS